MVKVNENQIEIMGDENTIFDDIVEAIDNCCDILKIAAGDEDKTAVLGAVVLAVTDTKEGYNLKAVAKILKNCAKEKKKDDD